MLGKWIWLPDGSYPNRQKTIYSAFMDKSLGNYTVAEFRRTYTFEKELRSMNLRFSGDTEVQLFCNGDFAVTGPASVGGDFLGNDEPRPNFYALETAYLPKGKTLDFFARVKMMPVKICDYSKGHGGFMLTAQVTFEDESVITIGTDESWQVRFNGAYTTPYHFDGRIEPDPFVSAQVTEDIWDVTIAPIPPRTEQKIIPQNGVIHLSAGEERTVELPFDLIYGGFLNLCTEGEGIIHTNVYCRELDEQGSSEQIILKGNSRYRGFEMHSAGNLLVQVKNESDTESVLECALIATHYPVSETARTVTDDEQLNGVLCVCEHTLKFCRQTHHLDSTRHCEPLACTGDYYIESLMTAFSFGDMCLAEFDILRTAELLRNNDGRIFHTTYSLIWVLMLRDVYKITGNVSVLQSCADALDLLLARFETYIGDNGLVETPPDYMFVDWIYIDEITLHHPPKALGQSCLNMFYFGALSAAEYVYCEIGQEEKSSACARKRDFLGKAINACLYDGEKGLYFEGLNTPTPEEMLYDYLPRNVEKRYYLKHSNILAACFGACEDEQGIRLIGKIMSDECPGDYQPYFAHFLLEAIYRLGLREKYTLQVLECWKAPVAECPKGLVEGFVPPQPDYVFDHSHAWGGTPLYSLPKALLGLEILQPGYRKIQLSPNLLGLKYAKVELPTPYGMVVCELEAGKCPRITGPNEVEIVFSQ